MSRVGTLSGFTYDMTMVSMALQADLMEAVSRPKPASALTVETVPMMTHTVYGGVPLRRLRVPDVKHVSSEKFMELWKRFEFWGEHPKQVSADDVWNMVVPAHVRSWVQNDPTRLLLLASCHSRFKLTVGEGTFKLRNLFRRVRGEDGLMFKLEEDSFEFGIANNKPFKLDTDWLYKTEPLTIKDRYTVRLLQYAERCGKPEAHEAIRILHTVLDGKLAENMLWVRTKRYLDPDLLEKQLERGADPIGHLYKHLVPAVMNPTVFKRVVCDVKEREMYPSAKSIERYRMKLRLHGLI
jgi:hypothetical protein